jgi:ureidoglycolate hydrolase
MSVDPSLLEVRTHQDPGYLPVVDFESWRVAVLNYCDELLPENLTRLQRHDQTDEVFVLLTGRCILFIGDGDGEAGEVQAVDLVPGTVYNVKRGVWHNHTLSPDASVLVVENRDTTYDNSPFCDLAREQTAFMVTETRRLWS